MDNIINLFKEKFKIIIKDLLDDYSILDIGEKLLKPLKEDIL
jgi:hypothetical protein